MTSQAQTGELRSPYLILGDCAEQMRGLAGGCVDAIVTDPPYGINFMNSKWDCPGDMLGQMAQGNEQRGALAYGGSHNRGYKDCDNKKFQAYMTPIFAEALRVAKPGAHLLAFGGTRTYHRLACAIEDAGFEIRDCIMWVYGSGFPKSMDVSKAIDKMKGAERTEVLGYKNQSDMRGGALMETQGKPRLNIPVTAPATPEAAAWNGWGTCLKPACEPIVIARKPLEGTVAANVLKYGTGSINIDGCRVKTEETVVIHSPTRKTLLDSGHKDLGTWENTKGRFPANLIHDGSDEVLALFPDNTKGGTWQRTDKARHFNNNGAATNCVCTGKDTSVGSAARFFYCAKASRSERGEGNVHPTVKPLALMRYLVRLVTRKGGIVLDPFMGSGTTGVAAIQEGMNFIGIEKDPHYYEIAQRRISQTKREQEGPIQLDLFA